MLQYYTNKETIFDFDCPYIYFLKNILINFLFTILLT